MADDDDPYRERGPVAPMALVKLARGELPAVRRHEPSPPPPDPEAELARLRDALDVQPRSGCAMVPLVITGVILLGASAGDVGGTMTGILMIVLGLGAEILTQRSSEQRAQQLIAADTTAPYRIVGYDAWLRGGQPSFVVRLRGPVVRDVVVGACATVDPRILIEWLDDRAFRAWLPLHGVGDPIRWVADRRGWLRFQALVLSPLHIEIGIELVDMIGRAALPPGP